MADFLESLKHGKICDYFLKVIGTNKNGIAWIGMDGLVNMESAALLTIFLMIFLSKSVSMLLSFLVITIKCLKDKRNGHKKELHDFVCALVGVVFGAILGLMM